MHDNAAPLDDIAAIAGFDHDAEKFSRSIVSGEHTRDIAVQSWQYLQIAGGLDPVHDLLPHARKKLLDGLIETAS